MIGVPIEGAENVFCDNLSVYKNDSFDECQHKKKYQAIYFHRSRECMAAKIIIFHKVDANDIISDLLTKSLPGWNCVQLRSRIIY